MNRSQELQIEVTRGSAESKEADTAHERLVWPRGRGTAPALCIVSGLLLSAPSPELASDLKGLIKAQREIKSLLSGSMTPVLALGRLTRPSPLFCPRPPCSVGTCSSAGDHDELDFLSVAGSKAGADPCPWAARLSPGADFTAKTQGLSRFSIGEAYRKNGLPR